MRQNIADGSAWKRMRRASMLYWFLAAVSISPVVAQTVNVTIQGRVYDTTGAAIPQATVTAVNTANGLNRSTIATAMGDYQIALLPPGDYTVTAERQGFQKSAKKTHLDVGEAGNLDFSLSPGQVQTVVEVQDVGAVAEPTRSMVSEVITTQQIENLPVNGRQFIDFALLAPGVTIGDTTSGSTDVIVEPVTKLSFAGQNIHFNFIAVDGADDISTASGIQRGTPPQESVEEFRVINTDYSAEFGRATAGIVNIITKSGTNAWHGSAYEYFRNDALDAISVLSAPGFHVLRQNQFGASLGGPLRKDKTFLFANYEGQRRAESPTYNSAVLGNIAAINNVKTNVFHLPAENLFVLRDGNTDNGFIRLDENFNAKNTLYLRYFINDDRLTNQSPLNNGFDLPSAFKNNFIRDQSLAGGLATVFSPSWVNDLRMQYAHRTFDFPVVSTQPHLEVANTFAVGVNRGNPDIYRESRFELVDNVIHNVSKHTISFGGNFDRVSTYESFPLFYPFESDFADLPAFLGTDGAAGCPAGVACPDPFVTFFERFNASTNPPFTEPALAGGTAVYQGGPILQNIRQQASDTLDHTYNGLYIEDKWRASQRLTLNGGVRWEFETWPSGVLNTQWKNVDPRVGLAYNVGGTHEVVFRAGFGLFHGITPSPLLMCQAPSCGGVSTYPGRPFENSLNAKTGLFSFASAPFINFLGLNALLTNATYPNGTPEPFCPDGTLATCGFLQDATIVRFDQNSKNPYGIQASASLEFRPFKDTMLSISGLHVRGVHLGSFYNVNQPDPSGTVLVHDAAGQTICKDVYFNFSSPLNSPGPLAPTNCTPYPAQMVIPGVPHINGVPGFRDPQFSVFFEATSRWDSVYDGLLVHLTKRLSHNFSYAISYTYSHSIDNGPNPSFVLIPQDSANFAGERASSADDARHRFVGDAIFTSPSSWNLFLRDFSFSTIVTLQSPQYFTKYAGFDANGDVFGNNDRVGGEPRNTFRGDSLQTVDVRLERTFPLHENLRLQLMAEAYNLLNTVNVRYFNTSYGAADFCGTDPGAPGCFGAPAFFREGSPNSLYGSPSSVFNPRQLQFVARVTW
ncbi:MAG TPA: carboxypeptidase regulatory-like domain-containing protein [Terriglobales bacterium]|nr:carboxypeptidase regulatory-like domain-containing protein [Terriglobales bacterium]